MTTVTWRPYGTLATTTVTVPGNSHGCGMRAETRADVSRRSGRMRADRCVMLSQVPPAHPGGQDPLLLLVGRHPASGRGSV
eukprot:1196002-Prorocentrum_minimum.AAC.2